MQLLKCYVVLAAVVLFFANVSHAKTGYVEKGALDLINGDEGSEFDLESSKAAKQRNNELVQKINENFEPSSITTCKYEVKTQHVTKCPYSGSAVVTNPFTGDRVRKTGGQVVKTYTINTLASQWNRAPNNMFEAIDIDDFNFYPSGNPNECDFTPFYHETSTVFYRFVNGQIAESRRVYFTAQYYLLADRPAPQSSVIEARLLMCSNPGGGGPIF